MDTIEGDLTELYYERMQQFGRMQANLLFIKDVLLLARKGIIRPAEGTYEMTSYGMIQSYIRLGFRSLLKRRSLSGLKLLGLTVGMGSFLLIQSYINYEESYDKFHSSCENIHRIDYKLFYKGDLLSHAATTPPTIAPFIASNVAGIESYVRVLRFPDLVIRFGNNIFREDDMLIVDPSFFQVFDFAVIEGDPATALVERGSMMISRSMQTKYFGIADPIGKEISIDGYKDYIVTGVFEDPPKNSHLQFDFLLSFETARWWYEGETETDWTSSEYHSYLLIDPKTDIRKVLSSLQKINQQTPQGQKDEQQEVDRIYELTKLSAIHLHSTLDEEIDLEEKGNASMLQILNLVSYIILLIVWFNYANQSAARLFVRSKEVGLRKVMGASRQNLITQFVIESFIIHAIALAVTLASMLAVEYFTLGARVHFSLKELMESNELVGALSILLGGFLFSSLVPVFFALSFDLTKSLNGKLSTSKRAHNLRKGMVCIQLVASVVFITSTLIVFNQLNHIKSQEPGFEMKNILVLRGPTASDRNLDLFKNELGRYPNVAEVSSGQFVPGRERLPSAPVTRTDLDDLSFTWLNTGYVSNNYLTSLGVKFLAGGDFDTALSEEGEYVVLNASAIQLLQFESAEEAVGKTLQLGSGIKTKIVGVVEDYLQTSAKLVPKPLFFWLYPEESTNLLVRFKGDESAIKEQVKRAYQLAFKEDPFDYYFLSDSYDLQFEEDQNYSSIFLTFTIIAVVMACLGLYSLTYWNTLRRTKEIGVRKVLGARVNQIIVLVSKELILLFIIALTIATPLSYILANKWLEDYASRIKPGIEIFLVSIIMTLLVVLMTVGKRTFSAATSDPVNCLRDE